jgi:hypothetical protein
MHRLVWAIVAAAALLATAASAADLRAVPRAAPQPAPSPWDVAFGLTLTSDYNFRGITQSNHKPSVWAYFEPRYNVTKDLQLYVGIGGESIVFPNRAAAEIDLYAGIRPTFGPLTLDFGYWYYWYPGGECFQYLPQFGLDCVANGALPINGNVVKRDLSFWEVFAKATYKVSDQLALGARVFYTPSVANAGSPGTYVGGDVKWTAPSNTLPYGYGLHVSAEAGYWFIGQSDAFYCTQNATATACGGLFPNGVNYADYAHWNLGFGITKSVFTLDFRYHDTNLNKGDCNSFMNDHTARFTASFTPINPGGFGSNWCDKAFIVAGKVDMTAMEHLK